MAITAELLKRRFPEFLEKPDPDEVQILLDHLTRVETAPNETVVRAGDHSEALYLICEGKIAFYKKVAGKQRAVGSVGPGRFFGVEAVIDPAAEVGTAKALEPSVLLRLDHATLELLGETHPCLASCLLRALCVDMVDWLRTFEKYMTERTLPNDIEEAGRMVRELRGLGEV